MKNYINTIEQLNEISISERPQYYLKRSLFHTVTIFTHNNEELIEFSNEDFKVEPFWHDEPLTHEDPMMKLLLDIEADESKKYADLHPEFKLVTRKTVYEKLLSAQKNLPQNMKIVVKAGYRPIAIQQNLFDGIQDLFRKKFSDLNEEEIYTKTSEYVSDPRVCIPPHSTGAALDITLYDTNLNQYLDMGTPINFPDDKSWTFNTEELLPKQIENRMLLTNTMLQVGFANLASEWWHFSYGDQRWAVFYDQKEALYNSVPE